MISSTGVSSARPASSQTGSQPEDTTSAQPKHDVAAKGPMKLTPSSNRLGVGWLLEAVSVQSHGFSLEADEETTFSGYIQQLFGQTHCCIKEVYINPDDRERSVSQVKIPAQHIEWLRSRVNAPNLNDVSALGKPDGISIDYPAQAGLPNAERPILLTVGQTHIDIEKEDLNEILDHFSQHLT